MPQQKLSPSPVFNQGNATPKHDEMLLMFSKDSEKLKEFIIYLIREKNKKIEEDFKKALRERFVFFVSDGVCTCYEKRFSFINNFKPIGEEVFPDYQGYDIDSIQIEEWTPERPIKNRDYYIGSVDLFVSYSYKIHFNLIIKKDWIWKKAQTEYHNGSIVYEFKPEIKSYSETLRQVKIYESYLRYAHYVVITNSDISKFQAIFESQGIKIYNP